MKAYRIIQIYQSYTKHFCHDNKDGSRINSLEALNQFAQFDNFNEFHIANPFNNILSVNHRFDYFDWLNFYQPIRMLKKRAWLIFIGLAPGSNLSRYNLIVATNFICCGINCNHNVL